VTKSLRRALEWRKVLSSARPLVVKPLGNLMKEGAVARIILRR
jgi:hypothetical protein